MTACVECGFCEPACPSRDLTTTPRQRIVLRREIARQPEGSPLRRALLDEYAYDGLDDLRRRRLLPARLPARDRHRRAGQGAARRAPRRAGRAAGAGGGEALGRGREGLAGGAAGRRPARAANEARRGRSPAPPRRAAADRARGRRRRLRPLLHQPDLRRAPAGRARRAGGGAWSRSRAAAPACRSGSRATWRGAAAGCRGARKASPRPTRHKANEMVERLWEWSGEGELPVVIDAASCTHAIAAPGEGVLERGERRAPGGAGDRRLGRLGARPPAAEARGHRQGRLRHRPPDLRDPPPRPRAAPAPPRRRPRRRRLRRPVGDLLRLRRRPRHLPPGADRRGDPPAGRGAGRPPASTPASPATAPARSASPAPPASDYESFVFLLERLTR